MTGVRAERGIAVLVVLVVIAIGALAGTVALLAARSASEGASASASRVQSRLSMRSGVLVLQQEAIAQRRAVLGGADFELDVPFELFEQGDRAGVFRLDGSLTERPVALDALLDVNTADAEMLAKLPGMDEALAGAVAARLPVRSIGELLEVEGMTAELVYGEYDDAGMLISEWPPLASLLTVGSVDPGYAVGVGSIEAAGERVDISGELEAERIGRAVELVGSQEGGSALARLLSEGQLGPASRGEIARSLRSVGQTLATSGQIFDGVCFGEGPARGRVDINRAPVEVLGVLPGLDEASAQAIVDARQSLAADELADPLWPLREGLVDEPSMILLLDRVTTRSVRWVLRAEAGMSSASRERLVGVDSLEDVRRIRGQMAAAEEDRLEDRVAVDLLVDFSGSSPVVVPLGEVSIAGELAAVARARRGLAPFGNAGERAGEVARVPGGAP